MNANSLLSAHEWAQQTFGAVLLGDQRRVERALVMAEAIAHDAGASLPAQMHNEADLHAAYRFLQNPQVSYERLMRPHLAQTREAMREHKQVLLIPDTTEVDYQPHPKGESKRQRELRERESQVWQRSVEALGPPPEGEQWIHIGDRYSDMYSFLWSCRQQQCDFVVRAAQDRCVDLLVEQADKPLPARSHHKASAQQPPKPKTPHLFEVVDCWAARGEQEVVLDGSQQRKGRVAHVQLSWGSVRLLPPRSQQAAGLRPLVVWVVHVWEAEPPEGVEPLQWLLLTSVPTESFEQACERVQWYRGRWIVEDYHQGLKTGCRIEQRQLQSYEALRRLLGLLAPAACRLLQMRVLARETPEQPASQSLPADVLQVVAVKAGVSASQLSTQQAWHTIAGFGGDLGRKGDGPPGWKTLWKGWFYLQAVLEGLHLAAQLPFDLDST